MRVCWEYCQYWKLAPANQPAKSACMISLEKLFTMDTFRQLHCVRVCIEPGYESRSGNCNDESIIRNKSNIFRLSRQAKWYLELKTVFTNMYGCNPLRQKLPDVLDNYLPEDSDARTWTINLVKVDEIRRMVIRAIGKSVLHTTPAPDVPNRVHETYWERYIMKCTCCCATAALKRVGQMNVDLRRQDLTTTHWHLSPPHIIKETGT